MKRMVADDAGLLMQTVAGTRSALPGSHLRCYCKYAVAPRVIFVFIFVVVDI